MQSHVELLLLQASAYEQAVDYLRSTGTLVVVGLPNEKLGANIFWTVFKVILLHRLTNEEALTSVLLMKSIKIEGSYVG